MADQTESQDPTHESGHEKKTMVGQLPHFALRANSPRPPARPFFKAASTAEQSVAEKAALERPSGDRNFIERMGVRAPTTSYTPPPQRRVTEIPNLNAARTLDAPHDGKKLVISRNIKVSGEISGCERLVVEGEVDATMTGLVALEVSVTGKVSGKAEVDSAVVHGSFDGTLIVHGHLEIPSGASVHGTISYQTVMVANGAKLSGTISILGV
jgi:cytoskeletal protein CcmA (bactofilin family)